MSVLLHICSCTSMMSLLKRFTWMHLISFGILNGWQKGQKRIPALHYSACALVTQLYQAVNCNPPPFLRSFLSFFSLLLAFLLGVVSYYLVPWVFRLFGIYVNVPCLAGHNSLIRAFFLLLFSRLFNIVALLFLTIISTTPLWLYLSLSFSFPLFVYNIFYLIHFSTPLLLL